MKQAIAFFTLLMLFFAAVSCSNTPPKNSMEAQAIRGKEFYLTHCLGCHGPDGKGGAEVAEGVVVTDLTTIMTRRGDDKFPVLEIARMIDGRNRIEAHGTTTMPIWGEVFTSGELMDEQQVEGKLEDIIAYLISIQAPSS